MTEKTQTHTHTQTLQVTPSTNSLSMRVSEKELENMQEKNKKGYSGKREDILWLKD